MSAFHVSSVFSVLFFGIKINIFGVMAVHVCAFSYMELTIVCCYAICFGPKSDGKVPSLRDTAALMPVACTCSRMVVTKDGKSTQIPYLGKSKIPM